MGTQTANHMYVLTCGDPNQPQPYRRVNSPELDKVMEWIDRYTQRSGVIALVVDHVDLTEGELTGIITMKKDRRGSWWDVDSAAYAAHQKEKA